MDHLTPHKEDRPARAGLRRALLIASCLAALPGAAAARHGAPPRSFEPEPRKAIRPASSVDLRVLPAVDEERLLAEDRENEAAGPGPLRFAAPIATDLASSSNGNWESLPDGGRVWRMRVISPGARSLNFAVEASRLPDGATLHIYPMASAEPSEAPPESREYAGPYAAADLTAERMLWSPIVSGDDAVLELYVPRAAAGDAELFVREVNHDYRGFGSLRARAKDQGSCNNDVVCPEGDPWRSEIRSVAVYTLGGSWTCTGTLLNSHAPERPPHFLTANHCGISAGNAGSMVVYWNFESPSCGMLAGGSLDDNQSGATFLAKWADSDFCLVRLNQTPDAASRVSYAGWDAREETAPAWAVAIHHPDCQEKAISFTNRPLAVTSYLQTPTPGNGTHWRISYWDDGTTEPGSSGSGLWDDAHHLVGQLHGGGASCQATAESDWYGRLSRSWDGGGTAATRLRDWLDPGGSGVRFLEEYDPPGAALAGDANVDGAVNVLDLAAIVNDILEMQALTDQGRTNADQDGNGRISIVDLVRVVNLILNPGALLARGEGGGPGGSRFTAGRTPSAGGVRPSTTAGASEPVALRAELAESAGGTDLILSGDLASAAAIELLVQTGLRPEAVCALPARVDASRGWSAAASVQAGGRLRLVAYTMEPTRAGALEPARVALALPAGAGRLEWLDGDGASASGEALALQASGFPLSSEVPSRVPASLQIHPNPAAGAWTVAFALPRPGAASLEVFDAGGRRVASRALPGGSEGANVIRWAPGEGDPELPPGLYFLRVWQGSERIGEAKLIALQ